MPRVADHDLRRSQIANAVANLIADTGYESVTIAKTARASGMSVGLVQHYFDSKEAMMLHAFDHARAEVRARVLKQAEAAEHQRHSIGEIVFLAIQELLPLNDQRLREHMMKAAFIGQQHVQESIRETLQQDFDMMYKLASMAITNGQECGEVPAAINVPGTAMILTALVDGLAEQLAITKDADNCQAALLMHLRSVFSGHCRTYDRPAFPPDIG